MEKTEKKVIMYDSPEAAKPIKADAWVSARGAMFFQENSARYDGCTHKTCDCGNPVEKLWISCKECRRKKEIASYNAKPFQEWDEVTPVYSDSHDKYFFSEDELEEYANESEDELEEGESFSYPDFYASLNLVICTPNYLPPVEINCDEFPEDQEYEYIVSKEVREKLDELNAVIKAHKPISYSPGKYRTEYKTTNP